MQKFIIYIMLNKNYSDMKIVFMKIVEVFATAVLPVAVDLLVSFLKKKIKQYEKETSLAV